MNFVRRVYFDTNAFIALMEEKGSVQSLLSGIVRLSQGRPVPLVASSTLTVSELLVHPFRHADWELANIYRNWFRSNDWLDVLPIDDVILENAAVLRSARIGLRTPDAIHLAAAFAARCSYFLTADMKIRDIDTLVHPFSGPVDITPLTVLRPDEPTLTSLLKSLTE